MLILKRPALEPERIELAPGAAIWARPATSYDYDVARAEVALAMDAYAQGASMGDIYGLPINLDKLSDSAAAGAAETITNVEIARRVVTRIEGIANEDGSPAEPSRETLALLFLDAGFRARFRLVAFRAIHALADEGNGSAPSPNGAAVGAPNTAADAGMPASPAPAVSAV